MRMWASRGDPVAGRVLAVAGVVVLAVQAERGPAGLVAADDLLLLVQGGAVPELDEHPDDADCLVAAAHRPGGLAVVGPDPDQLVHQPPVADVEVGRAVLEAEQVAVVAVQHPVQHQVVPGPAHQLAQGVEQHVGLVGRQGREQVAVALGRVEAVVGQERHPDQLPGPAPGWWRPRNGTRRPGRCRGRRSRRRCRRGQAPVDGREPACDAGHRGGVLGLEGRGEQLEQLPGAVDVGVEVRQVGVRVAVLLCGDLALGYLLDQLGRAEGDRRRRELEPLDLPVQGSASTGGTRAGASR